MRSRVNVRIENRDDQTQSFNPFDWRLQTPGGQVIDPGGDYGDAATA